MDVHTVLIRHRGRMLEFLNNASPSLQGSWSLRQFVETVSDDLDHVTLTPASCGLLPGEDVFLWCHEELLQLTEIANPGPVVQPYVAIMLKRLREMAPRLERNEPLPPEYQLHWIDDSEPPEDWDEEIDGPWEEAYDSAER